MAKTSHLVELVKSLSKAEKRHFRMNTARGGQLPHHGILFDVIDRLPQPGEAQIKEKMAPWVRGNQLHVIKDRLMAALLKSLRAYHDSSSVDGRIKSLLRDVEVLYRKELPEPCALLLSKAERLAGEHEKLAAMLEILSWKRKLLLGRHSSYQVIGELSQIAAEEKRCLEKVKNIIDYWDLSAGIFNNNSARNPDFPHHPLIKSDTEAQTLQAKTLRYHVLFADGFISGHIKKAESAIAGLVRLLEEHPLAIREDPGAYLTALNNQISLKLSAKKAGEIPPLLAKIRSTPDTFSINHDNPIMSKHLWRTYNVELEMYRDGRQIQPGLALVHTVSAMMTREKNKVPAEFRVLFYYQFAYLYYLNADHRQSLHWLHEIVKAKFGAIREDIQSYARLLTLIIHYQLGNIMVLKYAVNACRRFLKAKQELRGFEKILLGLFSRLSTTAPGQHRGLFEKTYGELFHKTDAGVTDSVLDYLDFKSWLENKLVN